MPNRSTNSTALLVAGLLVVACPARADGPAVQLLTLSKMKEKGLLSEEEYQGALRTLAEVGAERAADSNALVIGKWSTTLFGFIEADHTFDTTQSFNEQGGNNAVYRPDTLPGSHSRLTFSVRASRLGLLLRAPEFHGVRASSLFEMDFLGNQPVTSEAATFTNPTFRIRHAMLKLETPIVDVLIGQYWHLFGWQPLFFPNFVEAPAAPGMLYGRSPQIRLSKVFRSEQVSFEIAVAAERPPQRDSAIPDAHGGLRLAFNKWQGMQTVISTGTGVVPASIGVSGLVRHFELPEFSATPKTTVGQTGWGVAASAFLPIVPIRNGKRSNCLSLSGEYAYGYGIADQYSGLTGGVANAALPNPTNASPAPVYAPGIDGGMVAAAADGTFHLIQWQTYLAGLQYYLPGLDGKAWISANYAHSSSNNARLYGAATKVRDSEDWFDANLFGDVTPAVRLGLEYAYYRDKYVDGVVAVNQRVQLSAFYLF